MIEPWMVLALPPLDALVEFNDDRPNATVRVVVAPLDDLDDSIQGTLVFNDPLDQGLLAVVELDHETPWGFHPIAFDSTASSARSPDLQPDLQPDLDALHRHIALAENDELSSLARVGDAGDIVDGDGDVVVSTDWPVERPPTWPADRTWPPSGDAVTHGGICRLIPCCFGCPRNPNCVVPDPSDDPIEFQ